MSIGQGSIGEFAVSELPVTAGLDLAVGGIGVLHVVASPPDLVTGILLDMPVATAMPLVGQAPSLAVGTLQDAPVATLQVVGNAPQAVQSVNLLADRGTMQIVGLEPVLGTGVFIDNPSRQDSYVSAGGSIGTFSVAEFGIAEGPPETTLSGRRTARLGLKSGGEITLLVGKLIQIPTGTVSLIPRLPEVTARGRRLHTQTILS